MANRFKKIVTQWEPSSSFYFKSAICSLEELQDCLKTLKSECEKKRDRLSHMTEHINVELAVLCGVFSSGCSVEYIIMLCEYWKLQDETKYLALEIFGLFMTKLVCELHNMIFEESLVGTKKSPLTLTSHGGSAISPVDRKLHHQNQMADENDLSKRVMAVETWKNTLDHIKGQMKLRAVTSVMIASKATDHEKIVTLNKALELLISQGHHYSKNIIIKSELRILNTINYDVRHSLSLHPYVMIFLEILCRGGDFFNGAKIYSVCIRLLDLLYCHRSLVLGSIFNIRVSESGVLEFESEEQVRYFLESSCNLVRISAILVSAATYIADKSLSDRVIIHLSGLIDVDERVLTQACCAMLKALLC